MKVTVSIQIEDGASAPVVVAEIEGDGRLRAATLGLTLAESKHLLTEVQRELVQSQFAAFAAGVVVTKLSKVPVAKCRENRHLHGISCLSD